MPRPALVNVGDGFAARVVAGNGPTILWIHGYTLDSSCWAPLWELLPDWRHIGIDLPGHGASLPLRPREDLPGLARSIGRIAVQNEVSHIVAHSFGTLVALQLAIEFPRAFATVTLGAPTLGGGPEDRQVHRLYDELGELYRARGVDHHLRDRWMRSPPGLFEGAAGRPQLWKQLWQIVGRHPWWELGDGALTRLCQCPQPPARLLPIRAAFLLLVGENDLETFKRAAELIRRSVATGQRIYLPDVGHLCMLEDPPTSHTILESHFRAYQSVPA
jgi:pimeloyl-ACP methyl ester carboxylesterase